MSGFLSVVTNENLVRLFDIVILDEGTCGRRPRFLRLQGAEDRVTKIADCTYVLYAYPYIVIDYLCSPDPWIFQSSAVGFPPL